MKVVVNKPRFVWTVTNDMRYWRNSYWHNIKITVTYRTQQEVYEVVKTYISNSIEEEYWNEIGLKIKEVIQEMKLKRQML